MTAKKKLTGPLAAALVLALHVPSPWAAEGTFTDALARDYQALAEAERAQGDERDATTYARRGADAAASKPTSPETVDQRAFLKDHYRSDLTQGRERLMGAFDGGGRDNAPAAAARAQTSFECWLEQASEDLQPDDIAACRQAFETAVAEVEAAVPAPEPVAEVPPPPPPPAPVPTQEPYVIGFGLDEATLDAEARALVTQIKADTDAAPATRIMVVGHASRSGSAEHNMRLSQRRAEAVKASLVDSNVQAASIETEARGETDTLVKTGDGVREPRNRRVEVTIER
jgi:OOP family OmpA-OmpF porin